MNVTINQELCRSCGICGEVCPRHIPEIVESGELRVTVISPERVDLCLQCGHCAAVCPQDAVAMECFRGRAFDPVNGTGIDSDQLLSFVRQRRSVRRYRDEPISREVIDLMIEALSRYETLPFGLTIDEFVSYASTQFQYRYARIAKARTQSHAEMANEHLSALEAH